MIKIASKEKTKSGSLIKTIDIDSELIAWHELDITSSTMDFARNLARKGCPPWTLIIAKEQTSGRGTHGRNWITPHGKGLLLSLIVPPPRAAQSLERLSIRTAKVLVKTLKEFYDLPFEIKHPNDVRVGGRKIAGILFESVTRDEEVISLILGMGLNLSQSLEDFEQVGLTDSTSLFIEADYVPERENLIEIFLRHFNQMYADNRQ
ncbi:biotin--[acetyl-CoA-carboxylase] ligase [Candidatus Latescibacterota bacterium]